MLTFNLNIEGYWRDKNKRGIPGHPGIYFVYECTYNVEADTVTLLRILYIGESDNVNDRIAKHEHYELWRSYLTPGNELCYSTGHMQGPHRTRGKAAFIFKIKPIANTDYKEDFPFDETTMQLTGKTGLLEQIFIV